MLKPTATSTCQILKKLCHKISMLPFFSGTNIYSNNLKSIKYYIKKLIKNQPQNPNFESEYLEFYRNQNQLTQTCLEAIIMKIKQNH